MKRFIIEFSEIKSDESSLIGNKAARLAFLLKKKITIPKALVLTTEAFSYFLRKEYFYFIHEAMTGNLSLEDLAFLASDLRKKILETDLPSELLVVLDKKMREMGFDWFSVRSSATVEDSPQASFAGLFETDLNVDIKGLTSGIKKCWASAFSPRVVIYTKRKGIPLNKVSMAVIVQEMIMGDKAGTIRTRNLLEDKDEELMIEAVRGLSDDITSGVSHPERIFLDRDSYSILRRKLGFSTNRILEDCEAEELLRMGLSIEKHLLIPQEIEWIMAKKTIFILQSRPIIS